MIGIIYRPRQIYCFTILNSLLEFSRVFCYCFSAVLSFSAWENFKQSRIRYVVIWVFFELHWIFWKQATFSWCRDFLIEVSGWCQIIAHTYTALLYPYKTQGKNQAMFLGFCFGNVQKWCLPYMPSVVKSTDQPWTP